MKTILVLIQLLIITLGLNTVVRAQESSKVPLKLYVLSCGKIEVDDFKDFSDVGVYDGKEVTLANPCFLIQHPQGYFLWDTGFPNSFINNPQTMGVFHLTNTLSIADQLKEIGLTTNDIDFVSISHAHKDHTGGLEYFPQATWIMNIKEVEYVKESSDDRIPNFTTLKAWEISKKEMINGDFDVFKDGTVKILSTPGHTPGHQVLQITLPKSGVFILSGDAYHQRTSFEPLCIPVFNTSRAETIASSARIKEILEHTDGRLIIQHDQKDIDALPKFPNYLE